MSYSELIGNGTTYIVPPYQRDYSWDEENWDDLWLDILSLPEEKYHYMGYVVLREGEEKKTFSIIDGQQRFTTIAIISLACIDLLEEWIQKGIDADSNKQRKEKLIERFVGNRPASSLKLTSKLRLNNNSDVFFQTYLIELREPRNKQRLKPTAKLLWSAFEYFRKKVRERFASENLGANLAAFLEDIMAEGLLFTAIYVDDDINAYKVFETLNARGVKLSTADLLKNYIFSLTAQGGETDLASAERQWLTINETLKNKDLPSFLRYYWASRYPIETKQSLFKAIKKRVNSPLASFQLLKELEDNVDVFAAFDKPDNEIWTKEERFHIAALELFNVTQCYSLMLAAFEKLNRDEFAKILRLIEVISFRYNVIGGSNPKEAEKIYNSAAMKVSEGRLTAPREIFQEINPLYHSDEKFKNDFSLKSLSARNQKKLLRYILIKLENHIAETNYDFLSDNATIEHILPENPTNGWRDIFSDDEQETYTYRLGNYTPLEESKNRDSGTKAFLEKREIYQSSRYELSSEIDATEWTTSTIKARQEQMAKWATAVWRIDY